MLLSHTIYGSPEIQDHYADKMVLVDGMSSDDVGLALSYGFKKVISVLELCSLYPDLSPLCLHDFKGSFELMEKTKTHLLCRFAMTEHDFKKAL
jgi:hypothetical protein